jgi:hypothetical protein
MVRAQRLKGDVLGHDQLVVTLVVGKGGRVEGPRGQQLGVGLSDAPRRLAQVLGTEHGEQVGGGPPGGGQGRPPPVRRSNAATSCFARRATWPSRPPCRAHASPTIWPARPCPLLRSLSSVTAAAASLARPLASSTFWSVICVLSKAAGASRVRRERLRLILGLGRASRGQTLPTEASAGAHRGRGPGRSATPVPSSSAPAAPTIGSSCSKSRPCGAISAAMMIRCSVATAWALRRARSRFRSPRSRRRMTRSSRRAARGSSSSPARRRLSTTTSSIQRSRAARSASQSASRPERGHRAVEPRPPADWWSGPHQTSTPRRPPRCW